MTTSYIKRIEISKLWGKHNIVWDNLNPDVNILVGINGSGKSTLLKIIYAAICRDEKSISNLNFKNARIENQNNWHNIETISRKKKKFTEGDINDLNNEISEDFKLISGVGYENEFIERYEFISTFDVPTNRSKLKSDESPLMLELRNLILQTGTNSFNDYRLSATISPEKAVDVSNRINKLFVRINSLFSNTHKTIEIDATNNIVFRTESDTIQLEQLSSGEKQLLLILFKVFLMDEKPYVLLMDEPEISLHISWQQSLIETIRTLNPNCQLIIATHSPSIFGKGWGDKVTFMEKLFVN
ncbi:MAG: ATP-binding protein [Paludibacter sp.]|nr:ATP-binding protein [Paludibacter sp.]